MHTEEEPTKLTHKGFAHSRTTLANQFADTIREKALADKWEQENPALGTFGVQPILHALIPDCTQRDAQVAATVIQWLGSPVGLTFLQEAFEATGYHITQDPKRSA